MGSESLEKREELFTVCVSATVTIVPESNKVCFFKEWHADLTMKKHPGVWSVTGPQCDSAEEAVSAVMQMTANVLLEDALCESIWTS